MADADCFDNNGLLLKETMGVDPLSLYTDEEREAILCTWFSNIQTAMCSFEPSQIPVARRIVRQLTLLPQLCGKLEHTQRAGQLASLIFGCIGIDLLERVTDTVCTVVETCDPINREQVLAHYVLFLSKVAQGTGADFLPWAARAVALVAELISMADNPSSQEIANDALETLGLGGCGRTVTMAEALNPFACTFNHCDRVLGHRTAFDLHMKCHLGHSSAAGGASPAPSPKRVQSAEVLVAAVQPGNGRVTRSATAAAAVAADAPVSEPKPPAAKKAKKATLVVSNDAVSGGGAADSAAAPVHLLVTPGTTGSGGKCSKKARFSELLRPLECAPEKLTAALEKIAQETAGRPVNLLVDCSTLFHENMNSIRGHRLNILTNFLFNQENENYRRAAIYELYFNPRFGLVPTLLKQIPDSLKNRCQVYFYIEGNSKDSKIKNFARKDVPLPANKDSLSREEVIKLLHAYRSIFSDSALLTEFSKIVDFSGFSYFLVFTQAGLENDAALMAACLTSDVPCILIAYDADLQLTL